MAIFFFSFVNEERNVQGILAPFLYFFSTFLSFGTHKMLQTLSGEEGDRPKGSLSYNAEHFVCLFVCCFKL